jgi:hypothetical protein
MTFGTCAKNKGFQQIISFDFPISLGSRRRELADANLLCGRIVPKIAEIGL